MSIQGRNLEMTDTRTVERRAKSIVAAADRLSDRYDAIASTIVEQCQRQVPFYAAASEALVAEMRESSLRQTMNLLEILRSNARITDEQIADIAEFVRRRSSQGVPLAPLIHAYQVGARVVIDYALEELRLDLRLRAQPDYDRIVGQVIGAVLDASSRVSAALSQVDVGIDRASNAKIDDPVHLLLDENVSEERALAASDIPISASVLYVCASMVDQFTDRPIVFSGVLKVFEDRGKITNYEGAQVLLVRVSRSESVEQVADALRAEINRLPRREVTRLRVGLGRALPGVAGVRQSFKQATFALRVNEDLPRPHAVLGYDHSLMYAALLAAGELRTEIVTTTIGPLLGPDGRSKQLLTVLRSYLEATGGRQQVAKEVRISRRTVDRRLAFIEELTRRSVDRWSDRCMFSLALHAAELDSGPVSTRGTKSRTARQNLTQRVP